MANAEKQQALLVVDMLNGFLDPEGSLYCGDAARGIVPFVRERIQQFAERGDPVLFVCDHHEEDDPEFDLYEPHCVKGTWEAEILDALPVPDGAPIIPKTTLNPFYKTALDRALNRTGAEIVEVVGVCTNICVLYAAMELKVRGYTVRVPPKGVATFDADAHEAALEQMEKMFGVEIT